MNKHIPWESVVDYLKDDISEENLHQLMQWRSLKKNDELFDEIKQLWLSIQHKSSSYTPDEKHNWEILNKRLCLDKVPTYLPGKPKLLFLFSKYIVASLVILFVLGGMFFLGRLSNIKTKQVVFSTYNGKSKLILPDSTEVWLHNYSTIKYLSNFSSSQRNVTLIGEAYFKVTKNKNTPFNVFTDELRIQVHGTEFNVESYPESENVYVSLAKGSISVMSEYDAFQLKPKDEAIFNKQTKELSVISDSDIDYTSVWIEEKLLFENQSLDQIVYTLSKWYGVNISIDPLFSQHYTYTFTLRDEPLEEILRIMSRINPMKYEFDENNKLYITTQ